MYCARHEYSHHRHYCFVDLITITYELLTHQSMQKRLMYQLTVVRWWHNCKEVDVPVLVVVLAWEEVSL